jgi:hypothetical protein
MKTEADVQKRLLKLRKRYRQQYVQERVGRHHQNCVHNYEHKPTGKFKYSRSHDVAMSPRKQTTLLVIQEERPVRICMYGSNGKDWNGDVCDRDEQASDCPWFKPARTEDEVGAEFDDAMSDVEFVFDNYRDVAALQWVLDIRDSTDMSEEPEHPVPTSWLGRLWDWVRGPKPAPQLPPAPPEEEPVTEPNPEIPKGLWDADPEDSSS